MLEIFRKSTAGQRIDASGLEAVLYTRALGVAHGRDTLIKLDTEVVTKNSNRSTD